MKDDLPEIIIKTMRYAYFTDGQYPKEVDLEAWNGIDDEPGIRDFIVSLFRDEKKRGYLEGYVRAYLQYDPRDDKGLVQTEAKHFAETDFLSWEKDER